MESGGPGSATTLTGGTGNLSTLVRLASPRLADRDRATAELVDAGPRAIAPALVDLESQPGNIQARTLYTYNGARIARQMRRIRQKPLVSLQLAGTLRDAIAEVSAATDLVIHASDTLDEQLDRRRVAFDLERATPLQVLDALGVSWTSSRYGVLLNAAPVPAAPTSYDGVCRARMTYLETDRATDFCGGGHVSVKLGLEIRLEWLDVARQPSLRFDQPGVSSQPIGSEKRGWRYRCALDELPVGTNHIERLTGDVMCSFPDRFREVTLDPQPGFVRELDDVALAIDRASDKGCMLRVEAVGDASDVSRELLDAAVSPVIMGIDDADMECLAKVRRMHVFGGTSERKQIQLGLSFNRSSFRTLRSIRLWVSEGINHQLYPVGFRDVALL